MALETLAERYARALLDAAGEDKRRVGQDLRRIREAWDTVPDMAAFLSHPRVPVQAKEHLVDTLTEGLHPYIANLLRLLIRRGRVSLFPQVVDAYFRVWEEAGGPVHARVRTPRPLTQDERERLRRKLAEGLAREVELVEEEAPELLAGAELVLGCRRIDSSLRGRLSLLQRILGG